MPPKRGRPATRSVTSTEPSISNPLHATTKDPGSRRPLRTTKQVATRSANPTSQVPQTKSLATLNGQDSSARVDAQRSSDKGATEEVTFSKQPVPRRYARLPRPEIESGRLASVEAESESDSDPELEYEQDVTILPDIITATSGQKLRKSLASEIVRSNSAPQKTPTSHSATRNHFQSDREVIHVDNNVASANSKGLSSVNVVHNSPSQNNIQYLAAQLEQDQTAALSPKNRVASQGEELRRVELQFMATSLQDLLDAADGLANVILNPDDENPVWRRRYDLKKMIFHQVWQVFALNGEPVLRWESLLKDMPMPESSQSTLYATYVLVAANIISILDDLWSAYRGGEQGRYLAPLQQLGDGFPSQFVPTDQAFDDLMPLALAVRLLVEIRTQTFIAQCLQELNNRRFAAGELLAATFCDIGPANGDDVGAQTSSTNQFIIANHVLPVDDPAVEAYQSRLDDILNDITDDTGGSSINVDQLSSKYPFADFLHGLAESFFSIFSELQHRASVIGSQESDDVLEEPIDESDPPVAEDPETLQGASRENSTLHNHIDEATETQPSQNIVSAVGKDGGPTLFRGRASLLHLLRITHPNSVDAATVNDMTYDATIGDANNASPSQLHRAGGDDASVSNLNILRGLPPTSSIPQVPPQFRHPDDFIRESPDRGTNDGNDKEDGVQAVIQENQGEEDEEDEDEDPFASDPPLQPPKRRLPLISTPDDSNLIQQPKRPRTTQSQAPRQQHANVSASQPAQRSNSTTELGTAPHESSQIPNHPVAGRIPSSTQRAIQVSQGTALPNESMRSPWSDQDTATLLAMMEEYKCSWAKIQENHAGRFVVIRNQQAYRDRARNVKVFYLLNDLILPASFDLVQLSRKERERLIRAGKNPDRCARDMDDDNNVTNTDI